MRAAVAWAALLWALEAHSGSYTWSGALGAGASRSDSWSTGGPHVSIPSWDWAADLGLGGVPFRPGLLQFLANGQYRSLWVGYPDGSNSTRGLGYGLTLSLLRDSLLPISFSASRLLSRFVTDGATQRTGSTLVTTEAGNVSFRKAGYPSLWLQVSRTDLDNESFNAEHTKTGNTTLSAAVAHSAPRQEFSASYDTGWNDGSWPETNYRSHSVQAQSLTAIADELHLRLNERYFLRLPTVDAPTNPRYDDNDFGAGLQWRPGRRLNGGLDYSYRHLLINAPVTGELERLDHALRETVAYHWTNDLTVNGNASEQTATERRDGQSLSGNAFVGGAGANWRHLFGSGLELSAGGGGTVGVARAINAEEQLAYGAAGSAGLSAIGTRARGTASYSVAYQRNTSGLTGYSLNQQINLTGDLLLGSTLFQATALFSGVRQDSPLLGVFLGRSISASLGATWKSYNVNLSGGQSDGVAGPLAQPSVTDGLFLPANFNTRVRFLTLSTVVGIPRTRILVTALARALALEGPDRPPRHENSALLSVGYTIGATLFSLDERFSTGGAGGLWQTGNLVTLRVTRSFGGSL